MKVYESLKQQYREATNKGIDLEYIELTQDDINLLEIEISDLIDVYAKMQIGQINTLNYVLKRIALPNVKLKSIINWSDKLQFHALIFLK